jgi:hypothetical protein
MLACVLRRVPETAARQTVKQQLAHLTLMIQDQQPHTAASNRTFVLLVFASFLVMQLLCVDANIALAMCDWFPPAISATPEVLAPQDREGGS